MYWRFRSRINGLCLAAVATLLLIPSLSCRDDAAETKRLEFVREYVRSAADNTELHRKFTYETNLRLIDEARSQITPDFEVLRRDSSAPGDYEYVVRFSNGRQGIIAVFEEKGRIERASMRVDLGE